ncbi:hypothetical protein LSH36_151g07055 [Paralvinella palmiformis]|uniref:Uncharacterized protein n=1 Tax=Paralvinella palmiformis TaxID=53620 RepID=A0AAD9N729_9ANNE|nr:hypothetical protein LSH36_151g07055 [Paralvinella palmiformis]
MTKISWLNGQNSTGITTITEEARVDLEVRTLGQNNYKSRKEQRLIRLQSSFFSRICKATRRRDFENWQHPWLDIRTSPVNLLSMVGSIRLQHE